MLKKIVFNIGMILSVFILSAQQNDEVLLIVNNDSVKTSEFLKVYNKNLDLVKDVSQKELDVYLDLFVDYQLKLNEAKRLELDKDKKYQREFQNYKNQLTKNYLSESKVTEELVVEAYDRMKTDVQAVHILVRLESSQKDTLDTYNRMLDYQNRLKTEDFNKLRSELHDGQNVFVEDLGYFSAFKMVYDFESVAYNTSPGDVSMPFRTQFGYHVVKVLDKRPSRGTITAAHIMIALEQKDSTVIPQKRIQDLYNKLQQGESFESLAMQFSDDKSSAKNGGKLSPFKSGQLSSLKFENEAFSLSSDGQLSEPFQTKFGWHIVKRIKLDSLKSFETLKPELENKVKRDSRSQLINSALVETLEQRYKINENDNAKSYFTSILNDTYFQGKWTVPTDMKAEDVLFSINDKQYLYANFAKFLMNQQRNFFRKKAPLEFVVNSSYEKFYQNAILQFREENLENENEEFAAVLKEYRDGLLLFELMEREIWNKASKDSVGLQNYYEAHKEDYIWNDRVDVIIATSSDKKALEQIDESKFNADDVAELKSKYENNPNVLFTMGLFEVTDSKLPIDLDIKKKTPSIYMHNNNYHLLAISELLPSQIKTFSEAKGQVTNDYQEVLEQEWMESLKARYPVTINQEAFKRLKSKN